MKWVSRASLCLLFCLPCLGWAEDLVLDDFEYADDFEIQDMYGNSGWLGSGEAFISPGSKDGSTAMNLYLTFTGEPWGGGAVVSAAQEPFSFQAGKVVSLDIKGDAVNLKGDQAILVFQFRDANGEVFRFLDYIGPKSATWITIKMPFQGFEEGPYDANPGTPADKENLVSWEFYIQGVGGTNIDPFEAEIFIDNLKITQASAPTDGDRVLDGFEYANDAAIASAYVNNGWLGAGQAALSTDKMVGSSAMKLSLSYDGGAWGAAGVGGVPHDPFSLKPGQKVSYYVKGDPAKFTSPDALIVFQFKDATGEVIRFLDSNGLKSADWTQIEIPYDAFEEGPWDAHPETPADRNNLVSWDFSVQGVGPDAVSPYTAVLLIDQLEISTVPVVVQKDYVVKKIAASQAPNVTDKQLDAIYASAANEISTWEDDTFAPVGDPYNKTRAYLLTDGVKIYCAMVLGDPDTATLTTDTANDTLTKWNVDSWEIVFAPNPEQIDGKNYVKFAGDSAGYWDDISPDEAGGTDWNAPSFQSGAYIIDSKTWAAEFSVDVADIQDMIVDYNSYGHIGMQVKEPALNFAWPDRASFGSRNGHWDFSVLNPNAPVAEWALFE